MYDTSNIREGYDIINVEGTLQLEKCNNTFKYVKSMLPQCLRPSGEELSGGLNYFRRLLPRGSEGGIAKTPQINIS